MFCTTPADARRYIEWLWRYTMETSKNIFEHTNYELTQNQTYKIEDTLFIVEPVFNEEISKTLITASVLLIRSEVNNM